MNNNVAIWPRNDPNLIFLDTIYNFLGYKKLWWDILNVDGKYEIHYTKLKFGSTGSMRNQQAKWLQYWWKDYGVNRIAIDPVCYERYFQMQCRTCSKKNTIECFHIPCTIVKDLLQFPNHSILHQFMARHDEWFVLTKIKHQYVLNRHMNVRQIYTKAWDGLLYQRPRFPGIAPLSDPTL